MSDDAMRALAKRFFDCVEAGDIDGLVACYADDAKIWHNTDGLEQSPADNARTLRGFVAAISNRIYDDRRLAVFDGGFVHQHMLRGIRVSDGGQVALPACIVCRVKDGKITRLDEYFDSAHVAEFRKTA
jgi:ketosteroid isomerase-like protein